MALSIVWEDDFAGPGLHARWIGGHLNRSREVGLRVSSGLRFSFVAGRSYASAGVVTRVPITGDFDAELQFVVSNPQQGCTFEIAAIRVAPPAQSGLPPSTFTDAHRVFNVHGSPPYMSCELDENNGWRIGWNDGARQGGRNAAGEWIANNRDNQYGSDRFGPLPGATSGWLRLSRRGGTQWQASGRTSNTGQWQTIDSQSTNRLRDAVYLRLAAKHWHKAGTPRAPANEIVFKHFRLAN